MEESRNINKYNERWDIDRERLKLSKPISPIRKIKSIDMIIETIVDDINKPIQESIILLRNNWDEIWKNILNEEMGGKFAEQTSPICIKKNILYISVFHSAWINELRVRKKMLIDYLSNMREPLNVKDIYFELMHH